MNKRIKRFLFNTFIRKLMNFKGAYGRNGGEGVEGFIHLIINLGNVDNLKLIFLIIFHYQCVALHLRIDLIK